MPKEVALRFARGFALLTAVFLSQGCFLVDRPPPPRGPLDKVWEDWMLAGRSAHWVNGHEEPWLVEFEDAVAKSPVEAAATKHAILVEYRGQWGQGSWHLSGGLIGKVTTPAARVELFGKEIVREHGLRYVNWDEDYRYEFFLVVRPQVGAGARLVRKWVFPPEEVALAVQPEVAAEMREITKSEDEAIKLIKQQRSHYLVAGELRVEPSGPTAIVRILGMVRPLEERIDLSAALRQ